MLFEKEGSDVPLPLAGKMGVEDSLSHSLAAARITVQSLGPQLDLTSVIGNGGPVNNEEQFGN